MRRGAFTLLEVLLATALLAVVIVAITGWTGAQARLARAAQARLVATASIEAAVRAIEDDLIVAAPGPDRSRWRIEDEHLVVTTLAEKAGDPVGAHQVVWRFTSGALQRIAAGQPPRVATVRVAAARFVADQHDALALVYSLVGENADRSVMIRVRP